MTIPWWVENVLVGASWWWRVKRIQLPCQGILDWGGGITGEVLQQLTCYAGQRADLRSLQDLYVVAARGGEGGYRV